MFFFFFISSSLLFSFLRFYLVFSSLLFSSFLFSSLFSCLVSPLTCLFSFFIFLLLFSLLLSPSPLFFFFFFFSLSSSLFSLCLLSPCVGGVCVVVCVVVCVCVCGVVWCGVCAVWCGTLKTLCVYIQNVPVCRFKTSPCMPATRAHAFQHVRVLPAYTATFWIYTRRRFWVYTRVVVVSSAHQNLPTWGYHGLQKFTKVTFGSYTISVRE